MRCPLRRSQTDGVENAGNVSGVSSDRSRSARAAYATWEVSIPVSRRGGPVPPSVQTSSPPGPAVATCLPSGLMLASYTAALGVRRIAVVLSRRPLRASHCAATPSAPAVTTRVPLASNAASSTRPPWRSTAIVRPVRVSHTRAVPSAPAVTARPP